MKYHRLARIDPLTGETIEAPRGDDHFLPATFKAS
jgi:hypothetical protein